MKHLLLTFALLTTGLLSAQELVYQDAEGVIRYTANEEEMAVFGVNYCLPSASDYRAAHKVVPTLAGKKQLIDIDIDHLARMGMRALRLSFWGDWENSDKQGNLLDNEHLDLLDYLVYKASEHNILMLFSPVVAHAAWWPDGERNLPGLTAHFGKESLTFDKEAIRAQQNYMTQFLNYRNRYTGNLYKEEPHIIAVEILNEPARVMGRNEEIRAYIDTMTETIRATGCQKIVAYNISENFYMAPALRDSKAQCATYGWYPTQLNHGETLKGNFLPYVNDYTPMKSVDIGARSKFVYEFDAPDLTCSYMYPAQVREFREGGVQWAAMFSYDMLATAPWNLGWQTHLLNMVYTPKKAISAMIAVKAMQALPRGKDWGVYPANSQFGPVTVDWKADRSTYYDGETLLYSNSLPQDFTFNSSTLRHIAGVGSSALVKCAGNRIYFLDYKADKEWELEIYPSVNQVDDPFKWPSIDRRVFTLDEEPFRFACSLPGIEIDAELTPGRYRLSKHGAKYLGEVVYDASRERIFDPKRDYPTLLFTRGGFFSPSFDSRPSEAGNLKLYTADLSQKEEYWFPADISAQHYIGDRLKRGMKPRAILLRVRALTPTTERMRLLISEDDFASWGVTVALTQEWQTIEISTATFIRDCAPQLPQDWPGISPYYRPDFGGRDKEVDWSAVENIYFSLRGSDYADQGTAPKGIEVESVEVRY